MRRGSNSKMERVKSYKKREEKGVGKVIEENIDLFPFLSEKKKIKETRQLFFLIAFLNQLAK